MEMLYPRCAGLDVHKDMVMAVCAACANRGLMRRAASRPPRALWWNCKSGSHRTV